MARKAPTDEHIQSLLKAENFDPGADLGDYRSVAGHPDHDASANRSHLNV